MFNPNFFENTRSHGFSVLEVVDGTEIGEARLFVPLRRTELKGEVTGPLVSMNLKQIYMYSSKECDKVLEALYRFPLPGDAAVTGITVRFGEVEIKAELQDREQAEEAYKIAKEEGREAALVSRESPDVFTLQVAGIMPDKEITVETSYVQLSRPEGTGWSLTVPLTTSPRYVRSDEFSSEHAHGQPLLLLRDPGHRFTLDIIINGASEVISPTHRLYIERYEDRVKIRLQDGEVIPDRDFVISWWLVQEEQPTIKVVPYTDVKRKDLYLLVLIVPPKVFKKEHIIPREVILLVDHSASMRGSKWDATDWTVKKYMSKMTDRDLFNIGLFHNNTRWFSKNLQNATVEKIQEATKFLEYHRDSGGTELGVALEQALAMGRKEGVYSRHILIITDAQVTDIGRILRLVEQESAQEDHRRISVVCIDTAPHSYLVNEIAERGAGIAKFLTSSPDEEDITTTLDEVLENWSQPLFTNLRLELNRSNVLTTGKAVIKGEVENHSIVDIGDLPCGRAVWVVLKVPQENESMLELHLKAAGRGEIAACRLSSTPQDEDNAALRALFGTKRILMLEQLITAGYENKDIEVRLKKLGYEPEKIAPEIGSLPKRVYAENIQRDINKVLKDILVRESLDYHVASSKTAFVAIRKEKGTPVTGSVVVGNALPAGWSETFLSMSSFLKGPSTSVLSHSMTFHRSCSSRARRDKFSLGRLMKSCGKVDNLDYPAFMRQKDTSALTGTSPLFRGTPKFVNNEAVIYDSRRKEDEKKLPERTTFSRLKVEFLEGMPELSLIDAAISLQLYLDDLNSPRAAVKLVDLIHLGGVRPLNLVRHSGEHLKIILTDPTGSWQDKALKIEVRLE